LLAVLSSLPEPHRQAALASVPGHRAVIDAWMARRPVQTQCQLPRLGAPTNAPLSDHDCVTVTWTISSPDDPSPTEPIARRRRCLRRLMSEAAAQGASPTIPDLAKALGTSVSTTRRDLAFLRSQGHKIATRGNR
jgi:hypothetical protein